jgi:hypothetical protein
VGLARRFEPEHVPESSILTEMGNLRHFGADGGVLERCFGVRRKAKLQNKANLGRMGAGGDSKKRTQFERRAYWVSHSMAQKVGEADRWRRWGLSALESV